MTHTTAETDRQEFQALLEEWAAAIVTNDADRISGFTEPDWELVTPESGPVPLAGFLGAVRDGSLTHSEMTFDVRAVRRYGDLAVVIAHGTNKGAWRGEPFSADEWVTELFIRRDGHWRCALSSLTPNLAGRSPAASAGGSPAASTGG